MSPIAQQLNNVRERIAAAAVRANRDPSQIQLLAVSKARSIDELFQAIEAGQSMFGESYLQEALEKILVIGHKQCQWHFIGHCQSNKTASIAKHFDWVHSVDRIKIAQRLNDQRPPRPPLNICLQVNISAEGSKSGVAVENLSTLSETIQKMPNLCLRGLMALPAAETDFDKQRAVFAKVKRLFDELNARGHQLDTLSMGMSNDFEAAIMEGANIVRVGTEIFGPRPIRDQMDRQ